MKTVLTTILTAIILATGNFVHATNHELNRRAVNSTLNQYVATITQGNVADIDQLFSASFTHKISNNHKLTTHDKKELVNFLKKEKNIEQNCYTSYAVIEENASCALAKVEMKYENFTKVDYVTLGREGSEWKVNDVVSTYCYQ